MLPKTHKYLLRAIMFILPLLLVVGFILSQSRPVHAADSNFSNGITVDSTGDGADASIGDGICDDGSGNCTLRAAIAEANSAAGAQTINFNIAPSGSNKVIQPSTALPVISSEVHIDGYTQDDAVANSNPAPQPFNGVIRVQLDGTSLANNIHLLNLGAGSDGSSIKGLSLVRAKASGIGMSNTSDIEIQGNYVGLLPDGTTAAGNGSNCTAPSGVCSGVSGNSVSDVLVGGLLPANRNILSSNSGTGAGISIGVDHITYQGNYFGLAKDGVTTRGNGEGGAFIGQGNDFLIGGEDDGAINVASGNTASGKNGISVDSATDAVIAGNYVGTDWTGLIAKANGNGIGIGNTVSRPARITVGGTTTKARNVVAGNSVNGIVGIQTDDSFIQGNYVGWGKDGTTPLPNNAIGINFSSGTNTLIGGTTAGAANLIANSSNVNLLVLSTTNPSVPDVTNLRVKGNYIGVNALHVPSGSSGAAAGIAVVGNVVNSIIGGTEAGAGNTVYSSAVSVQMLSAGGVLVPVRNSVLGNHIYGVSPNIGIELCTASSSACDTYVGHTPNDAGDPDTGPNNYMNTPVITKVAQVGDQITFTYDLDAADAPGGQYRVEFFQNDTADGSGFGMGETFLGGTTSSTGSGLTATFTLPDNTDVTSKIFSSTTTAIDGTTPSGFGSTSEFGKVSNDVLVSYIAEAPTSSLADTGQNVRIWLALAGVLVAGGVYLVRRRLSR